MAGLYVSSGTYAQGTLENLLGPLWTVTALSVLYTVLKILAVILIGRLIVVVASRFVDRLVERHGRREVLFTEERRLQTLAGLAKSLIRYAVYFIVAVTVLDLSGVETRSILLGAGVAGLAVGFGAQNLVRDVLSGVFILLEDQFSVGDYISLGTIDGIVEEMGLRTTRIRAFGGEVHIIPNGTIERVTNFSRGSIRVLFEVEIAYEEDTSRVIGIVQEVLDRFAAESEVVTEGPKVLGVSQLGQSGVSLMVWAKVKPMEQWAVGRELRLRIKEAFDRAGIEIPYPRRVYIQGGTLDRPGRRPADTAGKVEERD
ncbi:MAG: mechanosensitive ion channel family protein [Bacillota bacterium]